MAIQEGLSLKSVKKSEREQYILLGLVELYIQTEKPVGSSTLWEHGFQELSTATIRNYFTKLEQKGYLKQLHSSGGRIPTSKAYKFYADHHFNAPIVNADQEKELREALKAQDTKAIVSELQKAAHTLSQLTKTAVFISAPRFDHDFILHVKLVSIDIHRCLCVIVTDFGCIYTETLHSPVKVSSFSLKRMEDYFAKRIANEDVTGLLNEQEERIANTFYNEVLVRYIVGYSNFLKDDIYTAGFAQLLQYPDFDQAIDLVGSLSLLENEEEMQKLLFYSQNNNTSHCWVGEEIQTLGQSSGGCAVLTAPYYINQTPVGAVGILGPERMPYREHLGALQVFCECLSTILTRNIYKYKLQYRQPGRATPYLETEESSLLLENKTETNPTSEDE